MTETTTVKITPPMKLTNAELTEIADYIESEDYWMEQKMDGARAVAVVSGNTVEWFASGGAPLKFAAARQHIEKINQQLVGMLTTGSTAMFDGELMIEDGQFRIFDLPRFTGRVAYQLHETVTLADTPYHQRRHILDLILKVPHDETVVTQTQIARGFNEKRKMWVEAQRAGVEGVVAKHPDEPYEWGKRAKHQVKFKLVKSADVFVVERRSAPNSAVLAVTSKLTGEPIVVGSCSMIGKEKDGKVREGDVLEVEYLYWTGDAMIQPRMTRKRRAEEKRPVDCDLEQFPAYSRKVLGA